MGAAFLCAIAEVANEHTDRNTTAYISRNHASDGPRHLALGRQPKSLPAESDGAVTQFAIVEKAAHLKFKGEVYELYESAKQNNHELTLQYSNEGIAESMKFARRAADSVLEAFRTVEPIFKRIYIDPLAGKAPRTEAESRLRAIVGEVVDREVERAQDVTRQLCSSF
jgi:hypothetical protein